MTQETVQHGVHLTFFCHRHTRHKGMLLSDWLLEQAKHKGIGGGSVFRAIAGFGRHGVLHEEQFFDLADDLPLKVEFLLPSAQAETMLSLVREAGVETVYAQAPVQFAVLGH